MKITHHRDNTSHIHNTSISGSDTKQRKRQQAKQQSKQSIHTQKTKRHNVKHTYTQNNTKHKLNITKTTTLQYTQHTINTATQDKKTPDPFKHRPIHKNHITTRAHINHNTYKYKHITQQQQAKQSNNTRHNTIHTKQT